MVERCTELKKVKFGNSDMMVTEVCAGTMTWGSFNDSKEVVFPQLDKLMELGVNFIDTAELYPVAFNYGKTTEEWIGDWLEKRTTEGKMKREDIYLATKCNPSGIGCPLDQGAHSYEENILTASCKASIERMKCGYIDLYQLHWPSRDTPLFGCASYKKEGEARPMPFKDYGGPEVFERQVKNVKKLLDAGLIKYWGLSNENAYGITMFCMTCDKLGVPRPVSCQNDFSLIDRMYEGDTLEAAHRFGIVGLPYGPLAGGVLTCKYFDKGKYANKDADRPLEECRMRKCKDFQPRYGFPIAMEAAKRYGAIAEKWGLTPAELALAWAKQCWFNASIIIGSTTVRQVEENVNAFKITLPQEVIDEVNAVDEEFHNAACWYNNKELRQTGGFVPGGRHANTPEV
eukprot:TRINITY_DN3811_c0_g1_i4.p1 TRINITY_DN3811_c0_g1~~TRINITY_DN3811_c0_g1_i4.p1  ORF type:complete len:436 (-),score=92.87 TRINITY_DN3811_c0_g1_i4:145-1347(-)